MSSLMILQRVMETIRDKNNLADVPRPCEYFDLIGGTSTGGYVETPGMLILVTPNERVDLSQSCLGDWA